MRSVGIENFAEEIADGEEISDTCATLSAYGIYLMNGGTPEGYLSMTEDDIQIMYLTYLGMQRQQTKDILKGIVEIINKMHGGR